MDTMMTILYVIAGIVVFAVVSAYTSGLIDRLRNDNEPFDPENPLAYGAFSFLFSIFSLAMVRITETIYRSDGLMVFVYSLGRGKKVQVVEDVLEFEKELDEEFGDE